MKTSIEAINAIIISKMGAITAWENYVLNKNAPIEITILKGEITSLETARNIIEKNSYESELFEFDTAYLIMSLSIQEKSTLCELCGDEVIECDNFIIGKLYEKELLENHITGKLTIKGRQIAEYLTLWVDIPLTYIERNILIDMYDTGNVQESSYDALVSLQKSNLLIDNKLTTKGKEYAKWIVWSLSSMKRNR